MIGRPEILDVKVTLRGKPLEISVWIRRAAGSRVLTYLHGAGGTKEEVFDAVHEESVAGFTLAAFDFPGCGRSPYPGDLRIDDLVDVTREALSSLGIRRTVLAGHSMGGLAALLLARRHPGTVAGFINIEGNLGPEDCFLSRRAVEDPAAADPDRFVRELAGKLALEPRRGYALYAARLPHTFRPAACVDYFRSIVEHSDRGDLLEQFLALEMPAAFVHGVENRSLPYLPRLRKAGVTIVEIPRSGHFPMLTNPPAFLRAVGELADRMLPAPGA